MGDLGAQNQHFKIFEIFLLDFSDTGPDDRNKKMDKTD